MYINVNNVQIIGYESNLQSNSDFSLRCNNIFKRLREKNNLNKKKKKEKKVL